MKKLVLVVVIQDFNLTYLNKSTIIMLMKKNKKNIICNFAYKCAISDCKHNRIHEYRWDCTRTCPNIAGAKCIPIRNKHEK